MSSAAVRTDELIAGVPTLPATVRRVVREAEDTYTYWSILDDHAARRAFAFRPGQISMLGVFGVGEVPISVSSDPARPMELAHTVRVCGRVTDVIGGLRAGDRVTVRGPFGRPWPVERARGGDLVIVAGGLGMAPLRSAVYDALRHRDAYRRVLLLVGARDPDQMLFRRQLETWMNWSRFQERIEVHLTVDVGDVRWPHGVGVITKLFPYVDIDPRASTIFTCGPEVMMRNAMRDLAALGVPDERLWLTLERNMHCAVRLCGHCQLGPYFVCADGPIFRWDEVADLLEVEEL
jgi:NAD(P)H-flavin reductase